MKKLSKIIIVALLTCTALATGAFAAESIGTGTVNTTSGLRLRSGASTSTSTVTVMPSGAEVSVLENVDGWYKVSYKDYTGYCAAEYLDFVQGKNAGQDGVVTASVLNMRSAPSTSAPVVDKLKLGTGVHILSGENGWYRINVQGIEGYVFAEYICIKAKTADADADKGEAIVDLALEYLGCDYVYGGNGPDKFDCSGFTKYIFDEMGYTISRTAGSQMNEGAAVEKDDLLAGDLVFFSENGSYISHVAIYMGDGEIVHANTPSTGVIISDLSEPFYVRNYAGACRIV
ncbi:MAG: SH3 domain-containing protein [Oscillospiraceae bacterium]|nr:SH3 domain-containing protein [Oscillospiraceae bacterium]